MVASRASLVFACLIIAFLLSFPIFRHATVLTEASTEQLNMSDGAPEAAVVRHAPEINSGRIEGSVRQLTGENFSLGGSSVITSDLFVPGTPKVQINGKPTFNGVLEGTGSALPSNYQIVLSGNATLGRIVTRTDPVQPDGVTAPPAPLGTRDATLTKTGDAVGDFASLRNLTLKGQAGDVAVPPGAYGRFAAEGKTSFIFGTANSEQPAVYNLEELSLNGGSRLQLAGPVSITIANKATINGGSTMGAENIPLWLLLKIAGEGASIEGKSALYGIVAAPAGKIVIDGASLLRGTASCDRLVVNGNSLLEGIVTDTTPPVITIEQPLEDEIVDDSQITVKGTVSDESAATVTVNGILAATNAGEFTADVTLVVGENILTVVAVDVFGNSSKTVRKVTRKINNPPTVDAGADQTISLPDSANLSGTVADDGLPKKGMLTITWSKLSGPGDVTFGNAHSASTTASFSLAGTYVLKLTASDGALSADDDVTITVTPPNQAPTVNAGTDQTITLPSSANLSGTASDDGLPLGSALTITWSKSSGPGDVVFSNPDSASTAASFSLAGTYVLKLTASDGALSADDDIIITVIPQNQKPTVNAGTDQTITLPDSANLSGTVADDGLPAGSALTIAWSVLSGPGTVVFSNPNQPAATASFDKPGTYILRLTADDTQFVVSDDVVVTVNAPKVAQYLTPTPYLSANDSPFRLDACFALETFEDGIFNLKGVTANAGIVLGPGLNTDSVDGDDSVIDGNGQNGRSFFNLNGNAGITFTFNPNVIGFIPTKVGVVWTDGDGDVFFEAFDSKGASMGLSGPFKFPDRFVTGTTAEDRFLGVINSEGISAIKIYNTIGGLEVDHLQYSGDCPIATANTLVVASGAARERGVKK